MDQLLIISISCHKLNSVPKMTYQSPKPNTSECELTWK